MKNKIFIAAFAMLALVLGLADAALAGDVENSAYCTKNALGGHCRGNLLGFRTHADPNAKVRFAEGAFSTGFDFYASLNGKSYSCLATPATSWERRIWHLATLQRGSFRVEWNAAGECTEMKLTNSSASAYF